MCLIEPPSPQSAWTEPKHRCSHNAESRWGRFIGEEPNAKLLAAKGMAMLHTNAGNPNPESETSLL
jgi:hypothetical protein